MEGEVFTLANGSGAVETPASGDDPAVPNGFPSDKNQTLTLNQSQEEEKENEDGGSSGTIKLLDQEIQKLRRDRSELQGKLEESLAEMKRSESEKEAIASHASYLEGELFRTQEDLAASSSAADDAEANAQRLRQAVQVLEAERASLLASKAALESQIRGLEVRMAAYVSMEADLAAEREKSSAMDSRREREISVMGLKGKALEEELMLLKEEKEAAEEEVKRRVSREKELEKAVKELKERNTELEVTIETKEVDAATAKGLTVSWAAAGAAVTSTAAVAVTVTAIYLRHSRQR